MRDWQAVVFDLDDTLFPERDYVLSGFRAVAAWAWEHLAIPAERGFCELERLFREGARGDTFNQWMASHRIPAGKALIEELILVYREHEPTNLRPFPEVLEVLEILRGRARARLGIVSDGWLAVQQRKLAALELAPCFQAVVFSDQWGRECWKPSRRPFLAVLEKLGISPEKGVYIGDNPLKDFYGARALGMATVQVRRRGGEYAAAIPPSALHAPDISIASLAELPGLMGLRG